MLTESLKITIILVFCNIIAGIMMLVTTKTWLVDSGLIYLSRKPIFISFVSIITFSLTLVLVFLFLLTKEPSYFYINSFISYGMAAVELFFSFHWIINTNQYFNDLYGTWEDMAGSPMLVPIQHKLKCCGFYAVGEFANDTCTSSQTNSCYREIHRRFGSSLKSSGVFMIAHFLSHVFICLLFYKLKKSGMRSMNYGILLDEYN